MFVIAVGTRAVTRSVAPFNTTNGAIVDQAVFPTIRQGLDVPPNWITRRIGAQSALVVIEGVGSCGAGSARRVADAGLPVTAPSATAAAQRGEVGTTDALDAVRIARSFLAVDMGRLRWTRATGQRAVLVVVRQLWSLGAPWSSTHSQRSCAEPTSASVRVKHCRAVRPR